MPRALPRKPATTGPAMTSNIVTMMPPGSLPGITSLATAPTTNPTTNHQMMCMENLLFSCCRLFLGDDSLDASIVGSPFRGPVFGDRTIRPHTTRLDLVRRKSPGDQIQADRFRASLRQIQVAGR